MSTISTTQAISPISINEKAPAPNGAQVENPQAAMLQEITSTNKQANNFDHDLEKLTQKPLTNVTQIDTPRPAPSILEKLEDIPCGGVLTAKYVKLWERPVVAVKIGKKRVPFYVSTGLGGKTDVPTGKWYPLLGIDPATHWFNKSDAMKDYYDNPVLGEVARQLDNELGDIRDKEMPSFNEHPKHLLKFLNHNMSPIRVDDEEAGVFIEYMAGTIKEEGAPDKGCCCIL